MEFGKEFMEKAISDNGTIVKLMDMVFMSGEMGINMKVNGTSASDMETDLTSFPTAMYSLDSILMANLKDLVSINGSMELTIQDNLLVASNTAMESGKRILT